MIASAPDSVTSFYAEQPNYILYNFWALSLFEENGQVITNETGSIVIFNANDLQQVLSRYHRVWLLADPIRYGRVGNSGTTPVLSNFQLVFEGQNTSVWLYTS
jgi:hypothetical protein